MPWQESDKGLDCLDLFFKMNNPPKKEANFEEFSQNRVYVWLKGTESKVNSLRREIDLLKSDLARKYEKINKELKTINDDVIELKREQEKTAEKMDLIVKELRLTAGKEDLMVIKKYLDLWNPLNFVTQRDVERLIEEKLEEKKV